MNVTANPHESGTDELLRMALEECNKRRRVDRQVNVLIIPDRRCEMAIGFAELGAQVTILDEAAYRNDAQGRILAANKAHEIGYCNGSLTQLPEDIPGEAFDIIIVRRGLCTIPYPEARRIMRCLLLKLKIGGKLYVSVLGLHSELSEGYAGHEMAVEERLAPLTAAVAEKYNILGPVCLYSERNLFMLLLEAGASVLRTLTTTYGNVKGVAVRV